MDVVFAQQNTETAGPYISLLCNISWWIKMDVKQNIYGSVFHLKCASLNHAPHLSASLCSLWPLLKMWIISSIKMVYVTAGSRGLWKRLIYSSDPRRSGPTYAYMSCQWSCVCRKRAWLSLISAPSFDMWLKSKYETLDKGSLWMYMYSYIETSHLDILIML